MLHQFARVPDNPFPHGLDVGAVVAYEHHQRAVCALAVRECISATIGCRQFEIGSVVADGSRGRYGFCHYNSPLLIQDGGVNIVHVPEQGGIRITLAVLGVSGGLTSGHVADFRTI